MFNVYLMCKWGILLEWQSVGCTSCEFNELFIYRPIEHANMDLIEGP